MKTDEVAGDPGDGVTNEPGRRRPFWVVGLALLILVVAILGGAFYLNGRLRPSVGVEPVPPSPSAGEFGFATASPAFAQRTPTSSTVTPPAQVEAPSSTVVATETVVAGSKVAVANAYLHYWDVYDGALLSLDPTHLNEVMAGQELSRVQQQIDDLRSQNHAVKSDIEHHFVVVSVNSSQADVQDQFVDKSYLVDATSKRPLQTPSAGQTETIACHLQSYDGTWKVVSVARVQQ